MKPVSPQTNLLAGPRFVASSSQARVTRVARASDWEKLGAQSKGH